MSRMNNELTLAQILETEAYQKQKEILFRAINTDVSRGGDVGVMEIDTSVFEKGEKEREELYKLKKAWREKMKMKWGPSWTKRSASRTYGQFHHRMN